MNPEDIEILLAVNETYYKGMLNVIIQSPDQKQAEQLKSEIIQALQIKENIDTGKSILRAKVDMDYFQKRQDDELNKLQEKAEKWDYLYRLNVKKYCEDNKSGLKDYEIMFNMLAEWITRWQVSKDEYQQSLTDKKQLESKVKELIKTIKEVRTWYGMNQIHTPTDEAIKMINIIDNPKLKEILGEES